MPKEKNPYARSGIGDWLNRSTRDLAVADNNSTFPALAAGMDPQDYRQLQHLQSLAIEICGYMASIHTTIRNTPKFDEILQLHEEQLQVLTQQPKGSGDQQRQRMHAEAIKMKLDAIAGSDEVIELLSEEMELEPEFHILYQEAKRILGDKMTPDWPSQPATKQKKEKKKKKK